MKKLGILILSVAFLSMSFIGLKTDEKTTEANKVTGALIKWKGYKPTGSHAGTISLQSGNLDVSNNKLTGGSFVVDMTTIKDEDGSERLEGHLKSADFFEVEKFATSKFVITDVVNTGSNVEVSGDLTIKDVTKKITFNGTFTIENGKATLKSETIKINRANFNIKYKSKSFFDDLKDKFIEDEFDLQVTIVASL